MDLESDLRSHVERLAGAIGLRQVETPANLAAAERYVAEQLGAAGVEVQAQSFEVRGVRCSNLEVELAGSERPEQIVVLGAHYDTCYNPGANDNASGVAVLCELARGAAQQPSGRTVRFVAFVNEEPPHFKTESMGSLVYARRCRARGEQVTAMLSLETLGYYDDRPGTQRYPPPLGLFYPSAGNFLGFVGNLRSHRLLRQAVAAFRQASTLPVASATLPAFVPGVDWSDHWSFWRMGYRALMVTDTAPFRYPHYHRPSDTPEKLDYRRLALATRGLAAVVAALAA